MVGIPACVVGGLAYSYTSGKSVMDGIIAAYGALYKVPGGPRIPCLTLEAQPCSCCFRAVPDAFQCPCCCTEEALHDFMTVGIILQACLHSYSPGAPTGVTVIGETNAATANLMNILWWGVYLAMLPGCRASSCLVVSHVETCRRLCSLSSAPEGLLNVCEAGPRILPVVLDIHSCCACAGWLELSPLLWSWLWSQRMLSPKSW